MYVLGSQRQLRWERYFLLRMRTGFDPGNHPTIALWPLCVCMLRWDVHKHTHTHTHTHTHNPLGDQGESACLTSKYKLYCQNHLWKGQCDDIIPVVDVRRVGLCDHSRQWGAYSLTVWGMALKLDQHIMYVHIHIQKESGGFFSFKKSYQQGVVAHTFNPSTWEAEAGGFLSSRPACCT